jgi:hypothetical protein
MTAAFKTNHDYFWRYRGEQYTIGAAEMEKHGFKGVFFLWLFH